MGLVGELVFDEVSTFANAENILNVRQTGTDRLVRPTGARTVDGPLMRGRSSAALRSTPVLGRAAEEESLDRTARFEK